MTPLEALASATGVAARAMGVEDTVGTLAPGFRADLVVLDAHPTERIGNAREVHMVSCPIDWRRADDCVPAARARVPWTAAGGRIGACRPDRRHCCTSSA